MPIIGGEYQKPGREFCGREMKYEDGVFSVEISRAYGLPENERVVRSFSFEDDAVNLTDSFTLESDKDVIERFISEIEPDISAWGEVILDESKIFYDADRWECSVSTERITRGVREIIIYLIDFKNIGEVSEFACKIS